MRVAILGSSGFIGRNLLLSLDKDWETYAFFNTSTDFVDWVSNNKIKIGTTFIQQDLADYQYIKNTLPEHFDLVISLIGDTRKLDKSMLPLHNLRSDPIALSGFFKYHTCDKLLYFSSGCIFEGNRGIVSTHKTKDINPFTPYAIAKRTSEMLLDYFSRENRIKEYLSVRFFGAYGPYQRVDKISTKLIKNFYFDKKDSMTLVGNGRNLIDAMYVSDCIDWIHLAVQQNLNNKTVDFGYAQPITISTLAHTVAKICGVDNPRFIWDTSNMPKENYFFRISDTWFHPEVQFKYQFKVDLNEGIKRLQQFLSLEENKQWMVSQ
jgi:nucleoside-diphosphate-sugar epimerase